MAINNGDIVGYTRAFARSCGMRPTMQEAGRQGVVTAVNIYPGQPGPTIHKVLWDDEVESTSILEKHIEIIEKGN